MSALAFSLCILAILYIYSRQIIKHKATVDSYKTQLEAYKKIVPDVRSVVPMSHFKEVVEEKNGKLENIKLQLENTERVNGVYYDRVVILAKYNGVFVEL